MWYNVLKINKCMSSALKTSCELILLQQIAGISAYQCFPLDILFLMKKGKDKRQSFFAPFPI